jgi:hypothetical protein
MIHDASFCNLPHYHDAVQFMNHSSLTQFETITDNDTRRACIATGLLILRLNSEECRKFHAEVA